MEAQPVEVKDIRIEQLNKFFQKYNCPKLNYDLIPTYLNAADANKIDYRLLPSISLREQSCGKVIPRSSPHNLWGYGSARALYRFNTYQDGINFITNKLADGTPYKGKTNSEKLKAYGPHPNGKPSPTYYKEVLQIMNQISLTQ